MTASLNTENYNLKTEKSQGNAVIIIAINYRCALPAVACQNVCIHGKCQLYKIIKSWTATKHHVMGITIVDSLSQHFRDDDNNCAYCLSFVNWASHYKESKIIYHMQIAFHRQNNIQEATFLFYLNDAYRFFRPSDSSQVVCCQ